MSEPDNESKGFKVTDRRKFTSEGDPRHEAGDAPREEPREERRDREPPPEPQPQAAPPAPPAEEVARTSSTGASTGRAPGGPKSGASFLDLVGMLATNAMLQLGDVPNPASGERVENLEAVQDMISFLEILVQKTKGNLSKEEGEVLEQVLYDLRMRYMAKAKILDL